MGTEYPPLNEERMEKIEIPRGQLEPGAQSIAGEAETHTPSPTSQDAALLLTFRTRIKTLSLTEA